MRKPRVAFVNTHPVQYFAPLYGYLNSTGKMQITTIYLSDYSVRGGSNDRAFGRTVSWDVDLLSGYDARFAPGAERREELSGFLSALAPGVWSAVRTGGFDLVVVHGHTPAAMLLAVAAAKASGTPVMMRGETHLGLRRSALKAKLRRALMGALYRNLDGVLAIGSANRDFYRAMGVPEHRIFPAPYTVDNARFMAKSTLTRAERAEIRTSLGVQDERPIVLFAAKFQQRKRPGDLLRAAAHLAKAGVRFHLAMVGSGEMDGELRQLARALELPNIGFAGFVNQAALPRVYAAADVFVLPSEDEPWGLAVNEAMCAGLPIVASSEIGCAADLVRSGVNGSTFPAGNVDALAAALRPLLEEPTIRRRMGEESRRIISRWSYAECLDGLAAALASVRAGHP